MATSKSLSYVTHVYEDCYDEEAAWMKKTFENIETHLGQDTMISRRTRYYSRPLKQLFEPKTKVPFRIELYIL